MIDINELRASILRLWITRSIPEVMIFVRTPNDPDSIQTNCSAFIGDILLDKVFKEKNPKDEVTWEPEDYRSVSLDMVRFTGEKGYSKGSKQKLTKYLNGEFLRELKGEGLISKSCSAGQLYFNAITCVPLESLLDPKAITDENQDYTAMVVQCAKQPKLPKVKIREIKFKDVED